MESTILGKMGSNHIFQCHSIITPTYFPSFFLERGMGYMNGFRPIFGRFRTRRIFCRPIFGSPTTEKRQKNRFFQNFFKIDLNEFRYRFRVQNDLKHLRNPFPAIYHHSGRYRPLYQKSNFWPKSQFLRFSRIFDFSRYGRPYGRKG